MTEFQGKGFIVALAAVTVLADYFLKVSSSDSHPFKTKTFLIGITLYGLSAFGWVYMFKQTKMSTIGVIYSLTTVLMLAAVGILIFNESLNKLEVTGIIFAITSIVLLSRFG